MIRHLTITQLVENTADAMGLLGEHGVAWFIEADEHCLLFDTGQGQTLRHNAGRLGLSLERVEAIALSHGHYDADRLAFTARALTRLGVAYLAPTHCTGLSAACYFRDRFPSQFRESPVGTRHQFG